MDLTQTHIESFKERGNTIVSSLTFYNLSSEEWFLSPHTIMKSSSGNRLNNTSKLYVNISFIRTDRCSIKCAAECTNNYRLSSGMYDTVRVEICTKSSQIKRDFFLKHYYPKQEGNIFLFVDSSKEEYPYEFVNSNLKQLNDFDFKRVALDVSNFIEAMI